MIAPTRLTVVIFVAALSAGVPAALPARTPEGAPPQENLVQEAREAAALGDVEEAIRIYTEVLRVDPANDRAFWGLVRLYSSEGMDEDRLIPLLEARIVERPDENQARMELGHAYARIGDHDAAHRHWAHILETGPPDVSEYASIGALEIRSRMYEHALETFTRGRAVFRRDSLFSQELSTVHTALGDFGSAIDECFVTVNHHSGAVQWATNRIELMLDEGADRRLVVDKMDAVREADGPTVAGPTAADFGLAGSVYLVLDMPDRALSSFLRADEVAGGHGTELLEYAVILRDEGLLEESREAYLMVADRHPGVVSAARAGVGAARLLAEAGEPEEAVLELRAVAERFDGSSWGARALFEAAEVELDALGDPDAALATIAELRSRFGPHAAQLENDAALAEIDAWMRQGRFEEVHTRSAELIRDDVPGSIRENAMFARGFASFLAHEHERAVEEFRAMVEDNAAGEHVNDALRLMLVIANAHEAGEMEPADLLADAHAARIAGDDVTSRELLLLLSNKRTGEAVETEALLMLGEAAAAAREFGRAIDYYDRVITGTEAITPRAEAMMRKADILHTEMGRTRSARDQYLAILEELPQNTLSGEARRKLDRLRRGEEVEG